MPSGPKKRRATKKKQEKAQTKQADEFTSVSIVKVTIPIEKLAKEAHDLHEAKNTTGDVSHNSKAAGDESATEETEVSLLDVASNEDHAVSKDEPLVESSENLKGNESCGVVCNDTTKETEQLTVAPEQKFDQIHDLLSEAPNTKEMLEKNYDLLSVNDTTMLLVSNEAASVGKELEVAECLTGKFPDELEDAASVVESAIEEKEVSLLKVTCNEDNEMSNDETVVPQNAGCINESVDSGEKLKDNESVEEKKDTAPLVPVTVVSNDGVKEVGSTSKFNELLSVVSNLSKGNDSIKEEIADTTLVALGGSNVSKDIESSFIFHDLSGESVEGMKVTAQLVSDKDSAFILPRVGLPVVLALQSSNECVENTGCFPAPEIPFDSI
ncbi:uncharacterized protein LOC132637844 [Lycium barbarum]|uniref:uncharacterized protein LOC132637844 n=1 Tax=Lycium barbarum TaxID=112863 RepID=UPI00293EF064|nr:uncharacterized protein LOC132637844 [Lycium barbarum]